MKPWTYIQSTGELLDPDGALVATGYAGRGIGLNCPALQNVHDCGPLPQGFYGCAAPVDHSRLGPDAIPLAPFPANEMFNRGGFYVHGDNAAENHSASEGCIVVDPATRNRLVAGAVIEVVDERPSAGA